MKPHVGPLQAAQ